MRPASAQAWRGWLTGRGLFRIHGWLGMKLSILLVMIVLTGAAASVSNEIDWLLNPAMRVAPGGTPVSWGTLYDSVKAAFPEAHIASLQAPIGARFAAQVLIQVGDEELPRRVYVNPYTGIVQGVAGWLNVQRFLRDLHRRLFLPEWIGIYAVSSFGFTLLSSLITGVLVYKKWWRGFFRLRSDKGRRVFWGDAHRLIGVWLLWFLAVIAATGIWYFVEMAMIQTRRGLTIVSRPPQIDATQFVSRGSTPALLDIDRYVARAQEALPGLDVKTIHLPDAPSDPVYIDGQSGAWLVRNRANHVYLDAFDGAVLRVQKAKDLSPGYRWIDTADPLHFGDFGGLATKLIWTLSGLGLSGLTLTGSWLWLRRVNRPRDRISAAVPREPPLGRWKYLHALTLLLAAFYTCKEGLEYRAAAEEKRHEGVGTVGPWQVALTTASNVVPGTTANVGVRFICRACLANYKRLTLAVGTQLGPTGAPTSAMGPENRLVAQVSIPATLAHAPRLWLTIQGWDGVEHRSAWPLTANP